MITDKYNEVTYIRYVFIQFELSSRNRLDQDLSYEHVLLYHCANLLIYGKGS